MALDWELYMCGRPCSRRGHVCGASLLKYRMTALFFASHTVCALQPTAAWPQPLSPCGAATATVLRHHLPLRKVFKLTHLPLHDPMAVAYVIAPQLFEVHVNTEWAESWRALLDL